MIIVQVSAAILAELLREGTTWLQPDRSLLCRIIRGAPVLPVQRAGVSGHTVLLGFGASDGEPDTYCTPVIETVFLGAPGTDAPWTEDQLAVLMSLIQGRVLPLLGPGLTTYPDDARDGGLKHAACLELERRGQLRRQAAAQLGDAVQWVLWMPALSPEGENHD